MTTKFVKGHKQTRRTLKHLLMVVDGLSVDGTYEEMCEVAWKMYLLTQTLPKDDAARKYERMAYEMAWARDRDDEYQAAKWVVV
jgi:hypothetical protein